MIAAHLPVQAWPEKRLAIVAVDAETGSRIAFEAGSGVPLLDAMTASGALPGIYPLVTIEGRRYADGGAHSLYSADLAAGHDVVTIVSPIPLNPYLQRQLDTDVAQPGGATLNVIVADEQSVAAIGPDPLTVDTIPAAVDAGAAQARREALVWAHQTGVSPTAIPLAAWKRSKSTDDRGPSPHRDQSLTLLLPGERERPEHRVRDLRKGRPARAQAARWPTTAIAGVSGRLALRRAGFSRSSTAGASV